MPDYRHRFSALVAADRQPIRAEQPDAKATADGVVTLRIYDPIDSYGGSWGVSAKEFVAVLDGLPDTTTEIQLRINSPGGEVWEGLAILNALRAHKARVVAVVDGVAASAASFLACGVDELIMSPNSELFVHDAWGLCVGNAADMQKMSDDLAHVSDNIASIYAAKSGGTVADWRAAMAAETWYSAEEAVAAGLADRVDGAPVDDTAKNRFDLSIFNIAGRKNASAPASATAPSPSPDQGQEGGSMSDLTALRAALGLAEDATDDDVLAAAVDKLKTPPETEAKLPEGVESIDAASLEQLRADAAAGREARAEQLRNQREQLVLAAIDDGRIPPARKDAWVAQLEADPGAEQVLASLAKGTIPVDEIGVNNRDLDDHDEAYEKLYGRQEVQS